MPETKVKTWAVRTNGDPVIVRTYPKAYDTAAAAARRKGKSKKLNQTAPLDIEVEQIIEADAASIVTARKC